MTTSTLPISRLINVQVNLSPIPAQMQNLSNLLILGNSDVIDVVSRLRSYNSIGAIAADFGTAAAEYLAAVLWFEQTPQPTSLSIGRWAQTATSAKLLGATLSATQQTIATWDAVTTPGFWVNINGIPYSILPASFAGNSNLNGVAAAIQTALAASVAGTTCVWNSVYNQFQIEVAGSTGVGSTVSFLAPPTSTGYLKLTGVPADGNKFTVNGTDVVFANPGPSAGKVTVGGTAAATAAALYAFLIASADAQLVKFKYSYVAGSAYVYVSAATAGAAGDLLTLANTGANLTVSGATLSGGTATDISGMMGMTSTSSGAYIANGIATETAANCVALFDNQFGQSWYGLEMPTATDTDILNVAAYIEAATNKHYHGVTTSEAALLNSGDTTNIAYKLQQLAYNRTGVQFSSSNPAAFVSALARILTTNYNGNNTVITLDYKQEPGIVPETLAATQVNNLESYNANVFLEYNNSTAIFEPGVSASGNFIDTVMGCDWLSLDIQTALYNLLYLSPTKIPQTDAGNHQLVTTIESICSQAVTNGLIAPGVWQSNGFGTLNTGDFMPKGFYVYAPPIASQNLANRAARQSVVIQIAVKLAGAIQTIDAIINVNR